MTIVCLGLFACSGSDQPAAPARCTLDAPALPTGHLRVDGPLLRDELGRAVSLRGVNAGSRAKFAPYLPFEFQGASDFDPALAKYLDIARAWGIDVMRVTVNWAAWEPTRGTDDSEYIQRYEALLDAAWKHGIRTIVDVHQDVYAEVYCGDGFPPWTIPGVTPAPHHDCPKWYEQYTSNEVKAAFDRFWDPNSDAQKAYLSFLQRLVMREKDRPGVIGFEPLNEPNAGSADPRTFEAQILTPFYSRVAKVVNDLAPDALVLLDPQGTTSATHQSSLARPDGKNLVFAPHYYQPLTIFDGAARPDLVLGDVQSLVTIGNQLNMPTFLGEWGAARNVPDSNEVVAAHHAAFDTLRMGGTQWEYSLANEVWNGEQLDIANPDGTANAMVEGVLRPHAQAVAGTNIDENVDAESKRYHLTYTPVPNEMTDILLPAAAYSNGYEVELQGACMAESAGWIRLRADGSGDVKLVIRGK